MHDEQMALCLLTLCRFFTVLTYSVAAYKSGPTLKLVFGNIVLTRSCLKNGNMKLTVVHTGETRFICLVREDDVGPIFKVRLSHGDASWRFALDKICENVKALSVSELARLDKRQKTLVSAVEAPRCGIPTGDPTSADVSVKGRGGSSLDEPMTKKKVAGTRRLGGVKWELVTLH